MLAPTTAARLVRESPPLPDPWPAGARDLFVRLLAAGPGLLGVWETLDETGALDLVLPEWERVRLLPHASVVHRFTVDRHLVETCIEASTLIRRVARPDVLMVAALLHDIGKGQLTEHCVAGAPIAREIAERIGFDDREVRAGRRAGPLAPAPARDGDHSRPRRPGDGRAGHRQGGRPRGAGAAGGPDRGRCARHVGEGVDPLAGLADPRRSYAGPRPCSPTNPCPPTRLTEIEIPERVRADPTPSRWSRASRPDGSRVTVVSARPDRAARRRGRHARAAEGPRCGRPAPGRRTAFGVSVWDVAETGAGRHHPAPAAGGDHRRSHRRRASGSAGSRPVKLEPTVAVRPEASPRATVIEVRSADRPGLIHIVCCRARADGRLRAVGPRLDAGAAGGRRVLRPGGLRRARSRRSGPPRPHTPSARRWWTPSRRRDESCAARVRLLLTTGPDHRHPRNLTRVRHAF